MHHLCLSACNFKVWKGEAASVQKLKACGSGPDLELCPLITHPTIQNRLKNKHQQKKEAAAAAATVLT